MEHEEIFSNEPPMPRNKRLRAAIVAEGEKQPRRKYVRKTHEAPPSRIRPRQNP